MTTRGQTSMATARCPDCGRIRILVNIRGWLRLRHHGCPSDGQRVRLAVGR